MANLKLTELSDHHAKLAEDLVVGVVSNRSCLDSANSLRAATVHALLALRAELRLHTQTTGGR